MPELVDVIAIKLFLELLLSHPAPTTEEKEETKSASLHSRITVREETRELHFISIGCHGKRTWFGFREDRYLVVHFMLHGRIFGRIRSPTDKSLPLTGVLARLAFDIELEDGKKSVLEIDIKDPMGAAKVEWMSEAQLASMRDKMAPPLWMPKEPISFETFLMRWNKNKGRKNVEKLLLDQNACVSGVGTWILDQIVSKTGIEKKAKAATLSTQKIKAIFTSAQEVCNAYYQETIRQLLRHSPSIGLWIHKRQCGENKSLINASATRLSVPEGTGKRRAVMPDSAQLLLEMAGTLENIYPLYCRKMVRPTLAALKP